MRTKHRPAITIYVADGFADDCEELILRCSRVQPLTYCVFAEIWKDMNFAGMYKDRTSTAEIAELSEEAIHIAKHYMVTDSTNYEESVAGLFMVYALLNLQPFHGFAALRLCPDDVSPITRIEVVARRDRRFDVLRILADVLIKGPTEYHAVLRPRGLETGYIKYFRGKGESDSSNLRPKGVFQRQAEELDIMRELRMLARRYQDAKGFFGVPFDRNLNYVDKDMVNSMENTLRSLINGLMEADGSLRPREIDEIDAIQAVKTRAMLGTVNEVRHLTSVNERSSTKKVEKPSDAKPRRKYKLQKDNEFAFPKSPRKYHLKFVFRRPTPEEDGDQSEPSDEEINIEIPNVNDIPDLPVITEEICNETKVGKGKGKGKRNVKKNTNENVEAEVIVPEIIDNVEKKSSKKKKNTPSIPKRKEINNKNCDMDIIVPKTIDNAGPSIPKPKEINNGNCDVEFIVPEILDNVTTGIDNQANENKVNDKNNSRDEFHSSTNENAVLIKNHVTKKPAVKSKCKQEFKKPKIPSPKKNRLNTQIVSRSKGKSPLKKNSKIKRCKTYTDSESSEDETDFELVLNDSDDDYSVTDDIDDDDISIAENNTVNDIKQSAKPNNAVSSFENSIENSKDSTKVPEDIVVNINEKLNHDTPIVIQTENGKELIEIEVIDHMRRPNLRKRKITEAPKSPKKGADKKIRKESASKEEDTSTNDTVVLCYSGSPGKKASPSNKQLDKDLIAPSTSKKKPVLHPKLRNKGKRVFSVDKDVTITKIENNAPPRRSPRQNSVNLNDMAHLIPVIPSETSPNMLRYPLRQSKTEPRYVNKKKRITLNRMGILPVNADDNNEK